MSVNTGISKRLTSNPFSKEGLATITSQPSKVPERTS